MTVYNIPDSTTDPSSADSIVNHDPYINLFPHRGLHPKRRYIRVSRILTRTARNPRLPLGRLGRALWITLRAVLRVPGKAGLFPALLQILLLRGLIGLLCRTWLRVVYRRATTDEVPLLANARLHPLRKHWTILRIPRQLLLDSTFVRCRTDNSGLKLTLDTLQSPTLASIVMCRLHSLVLWLESSC